MPSSARRSASRSPPRRSRCSSFGYFRARRRRAFPVHGWLGWRRSGGRRSAACFARVEPVATYFTPIAWSAYILIADAAVLALTDRSRLNDAPIIVARMALLSIPLWLIFEAYNLRLHNWTYVGVPGGWPAALLGYGWSFATITPADFRDVRSRPGRLSASAVLGRSPVENFSRSPKMS